MNETLHLFKGALLRKESWVSPMDSPIMIPYLELKNEKENNITLTMVRKEAAEEFVRRANTVCDDRSKANELLPMPIRYDLMGDKAYGEDYYDQVMKMAYHLEVYFNNTAWDKGEIWFLYQEPK